MNPPAARGENASNFTGLDARLSKYHYVNRHGIREDNIHGMSRFSTHGFQRNVSVFPPPTCRARLRPPVGRRALRQGLFQFVHVPIPVFGVLCQTAKYDPFEIGGHVGRKLRRRPHVVTGMSNQHFHRTAALERRPAAQQRIGDGAERVNVAVAVYVVECTAALGLLDGVRGHILNRLAIKAFQRRLLELAVHNGLHHLVERRVYESTAAAKIRKMLSGDLGVPVLTPRPCASGRARTISRDRQMGETSTEQVRQVVEDVYRAESRYVFATLIRLLGDFDLAEEALHEAFAAAIEQWSRDGLPANPRAWLISTGRFRAIDAIRRRARFDASLTEVANRLDEVARTNAAKDEEFEDDRLRLIFTCCHPALASPTQVALTLREVCGLTTEEIASAFPDRAAHDCPAHRSRQGEDPRRRTYPTRYRRARNFPERLDSVLAVIYLVFNEGYSASSGRSLTRSDLSEEAIRLGRLLVGLLPDPEAMGLLALMLLQESRRAARTSSEGDLILLEEQDRSLWDREKITEAGALVERAISSQRFGAYTIQAAIAAVHAAAATASETDWAQMVALYDVLARVEPSPVVALNRAVAVAMRDGPLAGLELIDAILAGGELADYHLAHAARADLCRRLGRTADARASYQRALALARQEPERRFLERRLRELG